MRKILVLLVLFGGLIGLSSTAKAVTEVNTIEELKNAIENKTEKVEVKLGNSFPTDQKVELNITDNNIFSIDGNDENLKFKSKFIFNFEDTGTGIAPESIAILEYFHFDGEKNIQLELR